MLRIFVTGSADSLGFHTARTLISQGHQVILHARNAERAQQTKDAIQGRGDVLIADVSSIAGMKQLASEANKAAAGKPFDVVIHNVGLGYTIPYSKTPDGFAATFAVNSLAPYVLTALMEPPKRLVYVSSGLHRDGKDSLDDITWSKRQWNAWQAYSDSKLHNILLANAVARRWQETTSVSMTPGHVATKIDGFAGPGSLDDGVDRMVYLANAKDEELQSGQYYVQKKATIPSVNAALDENLQDEYLHVCGNLSGVSLPASA